MLHRSERKSSVHKVRAHIRGDAAFFRMWQNFPLSFSVAGRGCPMATYLFTFASRRARSSRLCTAETSSTPSRSDIPGKRATWRERRHGDRRDGGFAINVEEIPCLKYRHQLSMSGRRWFRS